MNWIDIIILVIIFISTFIGLKNGLIKQMFKLIALILAISLSSLVAPNIERLLSQYVQVSDKTGHLIALGSSFLLIIITVSLIGAILNQFISQTPLAIFNRIAGGLLSIIISVGLLSYLFIFIDTIYPIQYSSQETPIEEQDLRQNSIFYTPTKNIIPTIITPHLLYE